MPEPSQFEIPVGAQGPLPDFPEIPESLDSPVSIKRTDPSSKREETSGSLFEVEDDKKKLAAEKPPRSGRQGLGATQLEIADDDGKARTERKLREAGAARPPTPEDEAKKIHEASRRIVDRMASDMKQKRIAKAMGESEPDNS